MELQSHSGYSAQVAIRLEVNGDSLPVAQVGRDSLILKHPYEIGPTGEARVIITVDGKENIHEIVLYNGIQLDSNEVFFY
ncbi:hypothetical protein Psta_1584 [Pirellula staleyi DSM 6068]|uniref:Uncharacterized protein n=1 Tax=Pirellula staleyi (strain ATCC 27377 / DSM 6068 / ICPB 4128) TaxID=530564 RepID=D2QY45_PIRSD|nr:hypothetical protein [Pirellula staleyi]ADB16259.1 hypothetical protein Psta_1584 [Pirellula staleyi DSM 6068]